MLSSISNSLGAMVTKRKKVVVVFIYSNETAASGLWYVVIGWILPLIGAEDIYVRMVLIIPMSLHFILDFNDFV